MKEITIYGIDGCQPCFNAKRLSSVKKIPFSFIEVSTEEIKEEMKKKAKIKGNCTVPQIFCGDEHIGGLTEYKEWIKQNWTK